MTKNYLNLLGLACAARKIVSGETLLKSIRSQKVHLVLIANDASDNTKKKLTDKCHYYGIECYIMEENSDTLSHAIGKNRIALGICDSGFANKIKKNIGGWFYGKKEQK